MFIDSRPWAPERSCTMSSTEIASNSDIPDGKAEGLALLRRMWARRSTAPRHLVAPGPSDDGDPHAGAGRVPGTGPHAPEAVSLPRHQRPMHGIPWPTCSRRPNANSIPASAARSSSGPARRPFTRRSLLAVISRVQENDEVPEIEQRASAGAALGYVVLAADLLGYGAMAVSGRKVATQAMRRAFDLAGQRGAPLLRRHRDAREGQGSTTGA